MPYNPEIHSNVTINKPYKELLEIIRKLDKRNLREEIEFLITRRAKQLNIDVSNKGIDK